MFLLEVLHVRRFSTYLSFVMNPRSRSSDRIRFHHGCHNPVHIRPCHSPSSLFIFICLVLYDHGHRHCHCRHGQQSYTKFVHRVAQVSTILALAMPHSVFLAACIGFRVLAPAISRWVVHDTFLTTLLSVWYPLLCTLFLVTSRRHPNNDSNSNVEDQEGKETNGSAKKTKRSSRSSSDDDDDKDVDAKKGYTNSNGTSTTNSSSFRRRKRTSNGSSDGSGVNSNVPAENSRSNLTKTTGGTKSSSTGNVSFSAPGRLGMSPQDSATYWLRYWHVFGIVQAFGTFLSSIPIFGSFVMRHPLLLLFTAELKTLFFVWLFGMEWMLPSSKDAFLADALPLRLVHRFVTPILLKFFSSVSDAISEKQWQNWVVSKSETFLQMFVLVRMLSSEQKEWIVHVLKESRGLLIPSITLFMPGYITQFGVAFVQYILPSAKSAQARGDAKRLLYLQYWIMHCMVAALLSVLSGVLWWIPFSTHGIFILWCYLVLPHTIRVYYDIVEKDLAAFGILKISGGPADINDTTTAKIFSAVASRLPSASDNINDGDDSGSIPGLGAKTSTSSTQEDESDNEHADPTTRTDSVTITAKTGLDDDDINKTNNDVGVTSASGTMTSTSTGTSSSAADKKNN
jgi:hypothetical protein